MSVNLTINSNLCLKDPTQTELGRKIIQHSVLLIEEIGIDQFTFKKLAKKISSTEASVYRYFENKHLLFIYLLNWYWEWMKFRIDLQTMNIEDPMRKLKIVLRIIVDSSRRNTETPYIDEDVLHNIVVREGIKAYHSKSVDKENREGYFLAYKSMTKKVADILLEVKPSLKYPHSMASTLIETANNNIYFAQHLPRLTDIRESDGEELTDQVVQLLEYMVDKMTCGHDDDDDDVATQKTLRNGVSVH
jgi:AcrR family transcriptional regulator